MAAGATAGPASESPAGGLRQGMSGSDGHREGRMSGEHGGEARALHEGAVLDPAHRAVVWIGPQQVLRQSGQDRGVLLRVGFPGSQYKTLNGFASPPIAGGGWGPIFNRSSMRPCGVFIPIGNNGCWPYFAAVTKPTRRVSGTAISIMHTDGRLGETAASEAACNNVGVSCLPSVPGAAQVSVCGIAQAKPCRAPGQFLLKDTPIEGTRLHGHRQGT